MAFSSSSHPEPTCRPPSTEGGRTGHGRNGSLFRLILRHDPRHALTCQRTARSMTKIVTHALAASRLVPGAARSAHPWRCKERAVRRQRLLQLLRWRLLQRGLLPAREEHCPLRDLIGRQRCCSIRCRAKIRASSAFPSSVEGRAACSASSRRVRLAKRSGIRRG